MNAESLRHAPHDLQMAGGGRAALRTDASRQKENELPELQVRSTICSSCPVPAGGRSGNVLQKETGTLRAVETKGAPSGQVTGKSVEAAEAELNQSALPEPWMAKKETLPVTEKGKSGKGKLVDGHHHG